MSLSVNGFSSNAINYTRRAHNSSVVVLLKKVRHVLSVHRLTFFINPPSYNRDHLEYIQKPSL